MSNQRCSLYLCLYEIPHLSLERGTPTYHWTFLLDKSNLSCANPTLYHITWNLDTDTGPSQDIPQNATLQGEDSKSRPVVWMYQAREAGLGGSTNSRVRLRLCEVIDILRFEQILQEVHIDTFWEDRDGFGCKTWIREGWENLRCAQDVLMPHGVTWESIEKASLNYAHRKESEGRFERLSFVDPVPTWDMVDEHEMVA